MMCHVQGCGKPAEHYVTEDDVILPVCWGCSINAAEQGYTRSALEPLAQKIWRRKKDEAPYAR